MKKKTILSMLLVAIMCFSVACGSGSESKRAEITKDPAGFEIKLPEKIEKIMVAAPANAEILEGLGVADKIVAADTYSANVKGLPKDIETFDMTKPDSETLLKLKPDVIIATDVMAAGSSDGPYKQFKDAGICVIMIPSPETVKGIEDNITFLGDVMDKADKAKEITSDMEKEIDKIKENAKNIKTKKKVYFEIATPPQMFSMGSKTFINEMIENIGGENIFADKTGFTQVTDESILKANPDVILTSVNYVKDPIGDIKGRSGWNVIKAVKDGAIYQIDTDASTNPSQNIIKALKEMAKAIYPDQNK